ncbi:MAG: tRNA (adenosine(37)-N6)-dimethylallyltransferase MiaA [bacterium]|nr:tRNA (adenosine(37)-N6)-dimethylallyltransferase MiaA [bacterium]
MKIICILGPTACGKKEIAKYLLTKFGDRVHFISCDSRKVYRYMDIGTAKPEKPFREFFELIDIKNPDEIYSAGDFARDAEKVATQILNRGKVPVIVGGTPLYYKALFSDFFEEPKKDPEIRQYLLNRLNEEGVEKLYEELKIKDPETAKKLHPKDWLRITRALEIYYNTGMPASEARRKLRKKRIFEPEYIGITQQNAELYRKIEERTKRMFSEGLIEETKKILEMGYDEKLPSLNTIGYKETIKYLKGEFKLEEAISKTIKNTKIYARRQKMFFKNFKNVSWFDITKEINDLFNRLDEEILKRIS